MVAIPISGLEFGLLFFGEDGGLGRRYEYRCYYASSRHGCLRRPREARLLALASRPRYACVRWPAVQRSGSLLVAAIASIWSSGRYLAASYALSWNID